MTSIDLPDHILRDIYFTVERLGHIKGQPTLKERIRKALEYQEWEKERKLEVTA